MCEYCENGKIIGEWKPDKVSVRITNEHTPENHYTLVIGFGVWQYTEKIKFCPMCGNKLTNNGESL